MGYAGFNKARGLTCSGAKLTVMHSKHVHKEKKKSLSCDIGGFYKSIERNSTDHNQGPELSVLDRGFYNCIDCNSTNRKVCSHTLECILGKFDCKWLAKTHFANTSVLILYVSQMISCN